MSSQEGGGVMRVKTELVLEQLVSRILGSALQLRTEELGPASETVLAEAPEPQALARLGYASRRAETEMFEPARKSMPWLEEELREGSGSAGIAEIAREHAADEPDDKPPPGEGSWRVPGPGGHVRHYLALAAADEVVHGDSNGRPSASRELSAGEAKRCFLYGFYARCCEEVSPTTSEDGSLRG